MDQSGLLGKKSVKIMAGIMLAFFLLYRAVLFYLKAFHGFAWDYSINWTAALALRDGLSLYDRAALQQLAIDHIDSGAQVLFNGRFTSFIGLPTTAILHVPFSYIPYETSVLCYRLAAIVAMVLAILLTGLTLPAALRYRAWWVGVLCLLCWYAFPFSVQLGQVDAWVMLGLAAGLLAASRAWWKCAGVAIGVVVLLKISPGWLLLYCLLKRQWRVLVPATVCVMAGLLLSYLPQQGEDVRQFFAVILPSLGDSPLHVQNQSLGAFLARLFYPASVQPSFAAGIGIWKIVGVAIVLLLLLALYRATRDAPLEEGLAVAILFALLAGPLTWDHYIAWAIIPVMRLSARLSSREMLVLLVLLLPLVFPVQYLETGRIMASGDWRMLTGIQTSVLLVVTLWMIGRCGVIHDQQACRTGV